MSAAEQQKLNKWLWLALIFGAIALVVLLTLGTWQIQRLAWKESLLATIKERTTQPPAPLQFVLDKQKSGEDIEYYPVEALGYFDHELEQHFFATFDGLSGYYIYTPLKLANDRYIFVNRGFVPFDKKEKSKRPETLVALSQDVKGLARTVPSFKAGWVIPENDVVKNVFYWKDLDAMIARSGIAPDLVDRIFIDRDNKANPTQLPVGGVTIVDLPNNHLQYALTWYGLALTLIGVLGFYVVRQRKQIK